MARAKCTGKEVEGERVRLRGDKVKEYREEDGKKIRQGEEGIKVKTTVRRMGRRECGKEDRKSDGKE